MKETGLASALGQVGDPDRHGSGVGVLHQRPGLAAVGGLPVGQVEGHVGGGQADGGVAGLSRCPLSQYMARSATRGVEPCTWVETSVLAGRVSFTLMVFRELGGMVKEGPATLP